MTMVFGRPGENSYPIVEPESLRRLGLLESPEREFWGWYINFQAPFRKTDIGFDTFDHELDLWSEDGLTWYRKDFELLEQRVAAGLFTPAEAAEIRARAERVEAEMMRGGAGGTIRGLIGRPQSNGRYLRYRKVGKRSDTIPNLLPNTVTNSCD
ncbi:MAG TPA: DUF402 domain-containing protein [bacterium]|jgi:hypothetical protein|nr:DUF402 domain-containing protein [bacterium]